MVAMQRNETATNRYNKENIPCDISAEKGLLGSLLLYPKNCDSIVSTVRRDDFYSIQNGILYQVILDLYNEGNYPDLNLIVNELRKRGELDEIGGEAYIAEVMQSVQTAFNAPRYAEIIKECSTRRHFINVGHRIIESAVDASIAVRDIGNQAEGNISSITDQSSEDNTKMLSSVMISTMKLLDDRSQNRNLGVPTGFQDIDSMLGGFKKSELIILAARTGMGKTALALNIVENIAINQKVPTLFFSLEMNSTELGIRLLSSRCRVSGTKFRNACFSNDEFARISKTANEIDSSPLCIDDSPARTVAEIGATARRFKRQNGLGLIVIDYLGLIEPDDNKIPRQEQVAKTVRRLKVLAKTLEVPVLCLCQLNRSVEANRDNRPKLSHLRESGAIEQDADVVLFIHRDDYYDDGQSRSNREDDSSDSNDGNAVVIIAKQRSGPVGDVPVNWDNHYTRFSDIGKCECMTVEEYREYEEIKQNGDFIDFSSGEF